jgi:hypothetical protein
VFLQGKKIEKGWARRYKDQKYADDPGRQKPRATDCDLRTDLKLYNKE